MYLVSKYKVLSIGIFLFMLASLLYFLVLSNRVKSFQPLPVTLRLERAKIETGIRRSSGYHIRQDIGTKSEQIQQVISIPNNGTDTTPKMEDLDSFVMEERVRNFARTSTIFKPSNSVENDREDETLPSMENEEFTIVMLTYKRTEMMLKLLQFLSGLPKLNQLLLIWNNDELPGPEIKWPRIDYRLRLLGNGKNTLHNRYLPLSIVETEAIFLLDDDSFVVHSKLLEAFRIWQLHRDQIVGFKGRGVKWTRNKNDTQKGYWEYDTEVTEERMSLVLTGSAFIHRNFMDLYTYNMPKNMRKVIDETMNCDDLAINFLVSDAVQKSPIYVRHDMDFLCPGCSDNGLWTDGSHFEERTQCLNQFSKIMGYTPLFKQGYTNRNLAFNCARFSNNVELRRKPRFRRRGVFNKSHRARMIPNTTSNTTIV